MPKPTPGKLDEQASDSYRSNSFCSGETRVYREDRLDVSSGENERKHVSTRDSPTSIYLEKEEDCPLNEEGIPIHIVIPDWLKGNERERFLALLRKYNNCFTRNYGEPGLTDKCEFSIDTGNHAPINEKMRPTNPAQRKALKAELEELSRHKIIKPSFGPWSSHVVMVSKPGGGIRMVLDFRKINKITKYEAYPLPLLTDVLSSLEGNKYFSTLDATKSFWSVPIKEEDQEKTQFATPFGSYCFTRMAMGLKNASQHYCRVMDLLLGSLKYEVAMSFVDDLIVLLQNI